MIWNNVGKEAYRILLPVRGGDDMNFLKRVIIGSFIGLGSVAPGVSGGALAMIFGIYGDLVDAVGNFFKNIKKNLLFLIPIGIGVGLSIVIFSGIIKGLFSTYPIQTSFTFAGLITGTLPILFRQANKKGFKKVYIIPFLITLSLAILLVVYDSGFDPANMPTDIALNFRNFMLLIFYGFVLAGSLVIPGISGSVLLALLGAYGIILETASSLKYFYKDMDIVFHSIGILIPLGIGMGLGVLLFSKMMDYLLHKHYTLTYYAIIGFVVGSIPEFLPQFSINSVGAISIMLFFLGMALSYGISRFEKV